MNLSTTIRRVAPLIALGSTLLVATPRGLVGQIPGESVHQRRVSLRGEFLAVTYSDIQRTLAQWLTAFDGRDHDRVVEMLNEDVVYAPGAGWMAQGRQEVADSLRGLLARMSAYNFTIVDFDASSNLVYLLGTVHYQSDGGNARETVSAEASMILVRRGDEWRIRSYFERRK